MTDNDIENVIGNNRKNSPQRIGKKTDGKTENSITEKRNLQNIHYKIADIIIKNSKNQR